MSWMRHYGRQVDMLCLALIAEDRVLKIEAIGLMITLALMMPLRRVYRTYHVSKLAVGANSTVIVTLSKASLQHWEPQIAAWWKATHCHSHVTILPSNHKTCVLPAKVNALTAAYVSTAALLKPGLVSCRCLCQTAPSLTSRPLPARLLPGKNAVPSCTMHISLQPTCLTLISRNFLVSYHIIGHDGADWPSKQLLQSRAPHDHNCYRMSGNGTLTMRVSAFSAVLRNTAKANRHV